MAETRDETSALICRTKKDGCTFLLFKNLEKHSGDIFVDLLEKQKTISGENQYAEECSNERSVQFYVQNIEQEICKSSLYFKKNIHT